jgi:membrane complex biogenesis BtpA family protein
MEATERPDGRLAALAHLFPSFKPIIGTIHVLPLPGSPRYRGEPMRELTDRAVSDAVAYVDSGVDAVLVENEGDIPFLRPDRIGPETVACLTAITAAVREAVVVPLGVMVLANAAIESFAIAKAVDATFVRANQWANAYIANEGYINGVAAEALRFRNTIGAHEVRVLADVHVKHGSHAIVADRSVAEQTRDVEAFDADVLIATGQRTGDPTRIEEVEMIQHAASSPVIVGSGLSAVNAYKLLRVADGAIVGSAMKVDGQWSNPVDRARVGEIMREVNRARSAR